MKWITHIALAFFVVKITEISLMIDLLDDYVAYAVVSLFAVLPDIDFLIGIKHRTWTHSVFFTATAFPLILIDYRLALAGWLAVMSHLTGDMLTHSGVKLLYPYRETVFYLTPPNWRVKTGSSGEFMILGILIISSILVSSVSTVSEVEKIFLLSRDHVVAASLSTFENGAVHNYDSVKIVWSNGKDEIGIIDNGRLKIIKKDEILTIEIHGKRKIDKTVKKSRVKVKNLKRAMWKYRIITSYECDGFEHSFIGTGRDLYCKLINRVEVNTKTIGVEFYEVR